MPYLGVRPADITSAAEAEVAGDLTVDTNTLKVDAANNRVGVGTTTVDSALHIEQNASGVTETSGSTLKVHNTNASGRSKISVHNSAETASGSIYYDTDSGMLALQGDTGAGVVFHTNGNNERGRCLVGGGLTFNGDTAAANALDDYEEGTFTPTFSSGLTSPGYLSQIGTYVKVGAMVICSVYLRANSGTENSDHIRIGGLPFAFTSATDHAYGGFFTYNGAFWSSNTNVTWLGLSGNTTLGFYTSSGASIPGTNSNVAANLAAACRLTVVYRTDA